MNNLIDEIKKYGFEKKGVIVITNNKSHPEFNLYDPYEKSEGNVYLWIKELDGVPQEIIYIGKTGGTIAKRCGQHLAGFRARKKAVKNESKGVKNGNALLELLKAGTKLSIYSRMSEKVEVFGEPNISLCDAEENALIKKYKGRGFLINTIH